MAKSRVTTKRIAKLYAKHLNFVKVGKIVGLHQTSVAQRLIRARIIVGNLTSK